MAIDPGTGAGVLFLVRLQAEKAGYGAVRKFEHDGHAYPFHQKEETNMESGSINNDCRSYAYCISQAADGDTFRRSDP